MYVNGVRTAEGALMGTVWRRRIEGWGSGGAHPQGTLGGPGAESEGTGTEAGETPDLPP